MIEVRNTLFQPLTFHLAKGPTGMQEGLHLGPRERRRIRHRLELLRSQQITAHQPSPCRGGAVDNGRLRRKAAILLRQLQGLVRKREGACRFDNHTLLRKRLLGLQCANRITRLHKRRKRFRLRAGA